MRILVTGADGFIGSHLVEKLVSDGYEVRALVQYNSLGTWGWLDDVDPQIQAEVEVILGDIRDDYFVSSLCEDVDMICHLAALIAIPFSYVAPEIYIDVNVKGTLNLLKAALKNSCDFIHTSTSEVYGSAQYVPIDEKHPYVGQSPYSASKIAADAVVHSFYATYSLPAVILRPFNTYGPRQSARALIPTVITQIMAGNKEIKLGSLEPTRDFSYVTDTVNGFISCISNHSSAQGLTVNLGSGYEVSVGDITRIIAEMMGVDLVIDKEASRIRPANSEVDRLWSDNQKAKSLLGWRPILQGPDGLKEGLDRTISWFVDSDKLKMYKPHRYNI